MSKLEEQLRLAKEGGFNEIVIPVEEAEKLLKLQKNQEKPLKVTGLVSDTILCK